MNSDDIRVIIEEILKELLPASTSSLNELFSIEVGVSARHLHISQEDLNALFGDGYELTPLKDLKQPGQFSSEETVRLTGPKGEIKNLRILGPVREKTQIELSLTDAFSIGIEIYLPTDEYKDGVGGATITGPTGSVELRSGIFLSQRHIHTSKETADNLRLISGELVSARINGPRGGIITNILVRVSENFADELHLDTDEANALMVKTGDKAIILKGSSDHEKLDSTIECEICEESNLISTTTVDNEKTEVYKFTERLLTEDDVSNLHLRGISRIHLSEITLVSPLAVDKASTLGVEIIYPSDK